MSLRAALVDDLKTVTTITDITGQNIVDGEYFYEDFLNSKANSVSKFPAISIEQDSFEVENNITGHDNLIEGLFTIRCYQIINLQNRKARSASVRTKERNKFRVVDTLSDAVVDYLLDKRGVIGDYYLRQPHIQSVADSIELEETNRQVISRDINFSIVYSKT